MAFFNKDIRNFILLWLGFILFATGIMFPLIERMNFDFPLHNFLVAYLLFGGIINFPIFFITYHLITPKFFKKGKYVHFFLYSLALVLFFLPIKYFLGNYFSDVMDAYFKLVNKSAAAEMWRHISILNFISIFVIMLGVAWRRIIDGYHHQLLKTELENKNLHAELAFRKMQINPHFLFNTLNNIYSLSLDNSKETPGAILKLSEMMRYMLDDTEDESKTVPLQSEINFITDYIELVHLGMADKFYLEFNTHGDFKNKRILPLLLIPVVENAFKHGMLKDADNPIVIDISILDNTLKLKVKNKKRTLTKHVVSGVGLDNVKTRLQLAYPGKHELVIKESPHFYEIFLSVILT
jgi:two-component system, LytTR family, sensor kinase